jgi:hypothetical protein
MTATIIEHPLASQLQALVDEALARRCVLLARQTRCGWVVVVDPELPACVRDKISRHPNVAGPLIASAKACPVQNLA